MYQIPEESLLSEKDGRRIWPIPAEECMRKTKKIQNKYSLQKVQTEQSFLAKI